MARGVIGNIQLNQSASFYKLKDPRRNLVGLRTMLQNRTSEKVMNGFVIVDGRFFTTVLN